MKAAVLPLFCTCILGWNQFAHGVQPGADASANSTNRYAQGLGYTNRYPTPAQQADPAPVQKQAPSTSVQTQQSAPVQPQPPQLQTQNRRVGLPPIQTRYEQTSQRARQSSTYQSNSRAAHTSTEKILRPWEVPDTTTRQTSATRYVDSSRTTEFTSSHQPAGSSVDLSANRTSSSESLAPALLPEQTSTSMRMHVSQRDSSAYGSSVLTSRSKGTGISSANANFNSQQAVNPRAMLSYENSLREHSPLPASKLAAPISTARPLQPERPELVGQAEEYSARDGFTFRVHGPAAYQQAEQARTRPAASRSTNRLQTVPSSSAPANRLKLKQPRAAGTAKPLTTSSYDQRTAPGRWFRPNPLRDAGAIDPDSAFAEQKSTHDGYVQQTAAETAAYNQPGTGQAEPIPSLADEPLELPFGEETKQPSKQPAKAADPETDLNLDDFPFTNNGQPKSSPTEEPALPDSPFPAEKPAAKPTEKQPSLDDDFPFPLPKESTPENKPEPPAAKPPVQKPPVETLPPAESPTEEEPTSSVPMEFAPSETTPEETSPLDSPAPEVAPTSKAELKPITAISTSIAPPSGELPQNLAEGITEENSIYYGFGQANRGWTVSSYHWKATDMCHQPLYFEEVNLERYGYSYGALQPAVSYGQFLVNVIAMPYKVIAEPSREAVYTLGHYRPGNYAPYRVQYPPVSAAGGMFEAGVLLGLVFVIP